MLIMLLSFTKTLGWKACLSPQVTSLSAFLYFQSGIDIPLLWMVFFPDASFHLSLPVCVTLSDCPSFGVCKGMFWDSGRSVKANSCRSSGGSLNCHSSPRALLDCWKSLLHQEMQVHMTKVTCYRRPHSKIELMGSYWPPTPPVPCALCICSPFCLQVSIMYRAHSCLHMAAWLYFARSTRNQQLLLCWNTTRPQVSCVFVVMWWKTHLFRNMHIVSTIST